jgi:tetratricopeptide (TPR) repeat protein/predicted Ser/Thr protein kinase
MAEAEPSLQAPALARGESVDRFVVISLVGRGGMGEVYAAYDPELDRKVAIKLLRARGDSADGRARLLREAQAIAKLSHPNVVVVFDVGTFNDSVFIAMEFVEGRTLSGWMHVQKRERKEILAVFLAAGRGLAAAHAAGLVHRDFKPDNVMVTNEGQVRVMDFGLARAAGLEEAPAPAAAGVDTPAAPPSEPVDPDATMNLGTDKSRNLSTSGAKYLSVKLTQTGAMLGTPAYMAPEQFAMQPTDARTDQFSFSVALYEVLYGQRPFAGDSVVALMTNVTTGAVGAVPARNTVPAWMRKVVLRGLSTDPEARYPSMNALLSALETDPTVRPRRIAAGAALVAALSAAAVGARHRLDTRGALCRSGGERWAGIWDADGAPSARKEAIHRAFAATGKSYAEQTFTRVAHVLDEYVARWTTMYTDACEATHLRGEQSAEVLDLRMGCLNERIESVRALVGELSTADGQVVVNAVGAAATLPGLDRCADVPLLRAVVKPPEDATARREVAELRNELATFAAVRDSGRCPLAISQANALIPKVRKVGYQPLLADTLAEAARLGDNCGDSGPTIERLREAHVAAIASRHDEAAALTSAMAAMFIGNRLGQIDVARVWHDVARGEAARLGRETVATSEVADSEAIIDLADHQNDQAIAARTRARDIARRVLGPDDPRTIAAELNLGDTLAVAGHLEEALSTDRATVAHYERVLGRDHPFVALISNNLGEVLNSLGRFAEAAPAYQRSLDIWRESGTDAEIIAWGLTGLGRSLLGLKNPGAAVAPLQEALTIREQRHAAPAQLGDTRFSLARALWSNPADRKRAQTLATTARAELKDDPKVVAEIDAWLGKPPGERL